MIFRPELIAKIRAGAKTQTRRPADPRTPCRYQAGRWYALQPGRGRAAVTRILVTAVRCERLGAITATAARREGFRTREAFYSYWIALYGRIDFNALVHVVSFQTEGRVSFCRRCHVTKPMDGWGFCQRCQARARRRCA